MIPQLIFSSQRLSVLHLNMRYVTKTSRNFIHDTYNEDLLMMNMICKSFSNGTRCANCEIQLIKDHGVDYVKIRPKTNENYCRGQILKHVNITPINDIDMRKIDLYNDEYEV